MSDGSKAQPFEATATESEAPTDENEEPAIEGNDTRDDGDDGMDAKDTEDTGRFDVVMNGEEELQLLAVEFNPEVRERVGRWSADLPSGSITLYLPMPSHLPHHLMIEGAKEALGRKGQILDAQVKAGNKVVVRASRQDLRGWLGERNWFRLPGDETVRGTWCLKQY